jgi:speckle-type POZ protein
MLAARSPVFKAELCGPMRTKARCVAVEDMQPEVFRVLLHFAYTDSLPDDLGELEGDDYGEMIRHLLVAADRYAMDRLKLMCQNILGSKLDVENVATTLGLADQYNCDRLKDVCIEFMMNLEDKNAVMETKGYANLRRSCPSVIVEVYERTNKRRRICK